MGCILEFFTQINSDLWVCNISDSFANRSCINARVSLSVSVTTRYHIFVQLDVVNSYVDKNTGWVTVDQQLLELYSQNQSL
jgi:hypothetical protein